MVVSQLLIERGVLDIHKGEVVGFVINIGCSCFSPISFPDVVHVGIRVAKLGNSSVDHAAKLAPASRAGAFFSARPSEPVRLQSAMPWRRYARLPDMQS